MTKKLVLTNIKKRYDKKQQILSIIQCEDILSRYDISFKTIVGIMVILISLFFSTTIENFIFISFIIFGFWFSLSLLFDILIHYFFYEKSYKEFIDYVNITYEDELKNKKLHVEVDTLSWKNINIFITTKEKTICHNIGDDLSDFQIFDLSLNIISFNYPKNDICK
jgi:hypothetical protein